MMLPADRVLSDSGAERIVADVAAAVGSAESWRPMPDARTVAASVAAAFDQSFTAAQLGRLLGVSTSRVDHGRRGGRLYAFQLGERWRYAAWQLADGGLVPGLPALVTAIPLTMHPAFVRSLMLAPRPMQGDGAAFVSPVDWLSRGGEVAPVLELFERSRR
jgi:hypothetical protein